MKNRFMHFYADFTSFAPKTIIFLLIAWLTFIFSSDKSAKSKNVSKQSRKISNGFLSKTRRNYNYADSIITAFYLHDLKKKAEKQDESFPVKLENAEIIDL